MKKWPTRSSTLPDWYSSSWWSSSGHGGTALLLVIWSLAAVGVALQASGKLAHPLLLTGIFLAMEWAARAVAWPLFALLPAAGLAWLLASARAGGFGLPIRRDRPVRPDPIGPGCSPT
ncbi:hypothetical protein PQR37_39550 [Paraburkholderia nemoris]|uniref:hypothetical protein n=1 Tax=Paraburkholderia nemoris TaxID=2793076 RepID=UPI0038B81B54